MKYKIVIILLLISLLVLIVTSFVPLEQICGVQSSCETIQNLGYNNPLETPQNYLGIVVILFILLLTISQIKTPKKYKAILVGLGMFLGSIISIYSIYLQIFIIKSLCKICLLIEVPIILGFLIIFLKRKK